MRHSPGKSGQRCAVQNIALQNNASPVCLHRGRAVLCCRHGSRRGISHTVHEGVVARAMEKKGIISDRCELNRQIKADNALLRELRGQVKKLAQAVKNTLPALAEAMENLRKNLLLFCYQLGYLRKGKEHLNASLNIVSHPPALR